MEDKIYDRVLEDEDGALIARKGSKQLVEETVRKNSRDKQERTLQAVALAEYQRIEKADSSEYDNIEYAFPVEGNTGLLVCISPDNARDDEFLVYEVGINYNTTEEGRIIREMNGIDFLDTMTSSQVLEKYEASKQAFGVVLYKGEPTDENLSRILKRVTDHKSRSLGVPLTISPNFTYGKIKKDN